MSTHFNTHLTHPNPYTKQASNLARHTYLHPRQAHTPNTLPQTHTPPTLNTKLYIPSHTLLHTQTLIPTLPTHPHPLRYPSHIPTPNTLTAYIHTHPLTPNSQPKAVYPLVRSRPRLCGASASALCFTDLTDSKVDVSASASLACALAQ